MKDSGPIIYTPPSLPCRSGKKIQRVASSSISIPLFGQDCDNNIQKRFGVKSKKKNDEESSSQSTLPVVFRLDRFHLDGGRCK
jgi:hypothetical protein